MSAARVPGFAADLRVSPKPVIATLAAAGVVALTIFDILSFRPHVVAFVLLMWLLLAIAWFLHSVRPRAGEWFTVITLVALIQLVDHWLHVPGFLALLAIPTALAAVLISTQAAVVVTGLESIFVLFSGRYLGTALSGLGVALAATWAMLGVMLLAQQPVLGLARWSWQRYQQAQALLEEVQGRQVQFKELLDDLARVNRQLALTNEKLAAARLIAEEAQRNKAAFVANVSHELRTPLNMIIGLIELLVETPQIDGQPLPFSLLKDLRAVHRNCEHLCSLINDVLDLSQIEADRLALHREPLDLGEVIDKALAVVSPLIEKKGLTLRVDVAGDLPLVYCDRARIRQVIVNLLSNAARFTEEGGITVQARRLDQMVKVSVVDTGPGIAPEDLRRIFEAFYQIPRARRRQGGSGLGLTISKQFVELHGGKMWVESVLGVGSTFSFALPVSPPEQPAASSHRWLATDWVWVERYSRANLPIRPGKPRYVVQDETGELVPLLGRYGDDLEIVAAQSIEQAAQEVQSSGAQAVLVNAPSPDCALTLVEAARLAMPETPIIGFALPSRAEHALAAGAIDYLCKPVTCARLQQALQAMDQGVRRVLLVDDEPDALRLFTRMLHSCDASLEVITASTGQQALDELRRSHPDLLLLDVILPDMDGWEMLRLMNEEAAIPHVPVIMVSAQDPAEQPMGTSILLAAIGHRLTINRLVHCSRALSALLLQHEPTLDRVPG